MARILASELQEHIGHEVVLHGWLNNVRPFGKLNFVILRDRSGFAQIVLQDKIEYGKINIHFEDFNYFNGN